MKKSRSARRINVIIIIFILLITITSVSIAIFFFLKSKNINPEVVFRLNYPFSQEMEVFSDYNELGATVTVDGIDKTSDLKIDISELDNDKIGTYKIKYYLIINEKEYNCFREVNVIDNVSPVITLDGNNIVTILLNENFEELGYKATDNYDGDITNKVSVESNIDNTKVGEYIIKYTVTDSSGNSISTQRTINVTKPNVNVSISNLENKFEVQKLIETKYSNTITKNEFTNNGIYIEGYIKNSNDSYKIKFGDNEDYVYDLTSNGENYYKGNIDLTGIPNGKYSVYIISNDSERLTNKMNYIEKIVRSKVGNKLITFSYTNDDVSMKIEDFVYLYDILIDPGHGGSDVGTINEYIYEKEMNLTVSMYEKCRYEAHGLNVYMTRTSDTYGDGLGSDSLSRLHRRAYEIGYYGAVSKIVYSNHHNSINSNNYLGYEILLPGYLTTDEMTDELEIVNKFNSIYPSLDDHIRFYARDYDTEKIYSKLGGNVFSFKDNYAVNRIPHELFNVKSIIFESSYLSNKSDYDWYWNRKNWIAVSEAKIETYVEALGTTYNSDNSSCSLS